jgi:hypothetical protein
MSGRRELGKPAFPARLTARSTSGGKLPCARWASRASGAPENGHYSHTVYFILVSPFPDGHLCMVVTT